VITTAVQQSPGLSIKDAADHLGISQTTVRRRVKEGTLLARQQPTSQGFEWRIYMHEGAAVRDQVPTMRPAFQRMTGEEFPTTGDQVPITVDQIVATLRAQPEHAQHEGFGALAYEHTEPMRMKEGGARTGDQAVTIVQGIPWEVELPDDTPADTRQEAPAVAVTPTAGSGAAGEVSAPIAPTTGETQRLAELVDVLRGELAHRNTELEARAREVSELHVLLQQAHRALPHAAQQAVDKDMQDAPAPPRQHQRPRWAFWRRD